MNLLKNGDFESGSDHWSGVQGEVSVGRGGINQTGGLHYRRTDESYQQISQRITLKPGHRYHFGAMVRTQHVTGEGAGLYIEGYAAGQYVGGAYSRNLQGEHDWTLIEHYFTVPVAHPNATYTLGLYLRRGSRGEAWYDTVFVRESRPHWQLDHVYPTHGRLIPGEPLQFASRFQGLDSAVPEHHRILIQVADQDPVDFPVSQGLLALTPAAMPEGDVTVRATWINTHTREILDQKDRILLSGSWPPAAANAAVLDASHRLIVDGKPFMPLGLFTQQLSRRDIDRIAGTVFNCVLPYPSPALKFSDSQLTGLDAIREVMDYCHEKGLKVMFSLKDLYGGYKSPWSDETDMDKFVETLVLAFKDHPALLAWYICDELSVSAVPMLIERRKLINRLDPHHPTWSVYYQVPDYEHYIPAQDIYGIDPYPINFQSDTHILGTDNATRKARGLNVPLWSVPQIHHTGFYNSDWRKDPTDFFVKLRPPTEKEMNTIALIQAKRNCKAFIMYAYDDLNWGPDPLQFERRWPEVVRVAEQIDRLAPYLLSEVQAPPVQVTVASGKVYARAFELPDGTRRVIVINTESGQADAEIIVGDGIAGMLSEQGRSFETRPGVYRFTCVNTGYDILRSPEPSGLEK